MSIWKKGVTKIKYLSQFLKFHCKAFFDGKKFLCVGCQNWTDYETKKHMGTKVNAVIIEDNTPYKQKDGETVSNLYEKIAFKCKKDVNIPQNANIIPVNPVATVYGEYRNQLSIVCDDIQII